MNTEITTTWSEAQTKVIAYFQEKLGMNRSNAIRKLRGMELRGLTPEQILAQPVEPKLAQVQEPKKSNGIRQPKELNKRLAEMGDKAPHVAAKKAKAASRPKAARKNKLSMSKEARMALAKKSDKSELEIYMELCRKEHVEPAKSAQKKWDAQQKAAEKKEVK